jgi:hypothetical protein
MGAKWNEWDWDYVWHFLGGFAINLVPMFVFKSWPILVVTAILITALGILREHVQHDWEKLSAHQWLEGVLWGGGAMVVVPLAAIIFN